MKELHIIVKTPDTGNPLDQEKGRDPHDGMMSVGWKFLTDGGEWYGAYILLENEAGGAEVLEAVDLMLCQAHETAKALLEGEHGCDV